MNVLDVAFSAMLSSGVARMAGAALWGVASVLLSPCGIAVLPLIVGYIANSDPDDLNRWAAFKISCAFCSGIAVNLLLVAFVTSSFGLLFGGHERFLTFITAAVFIIMGLNLTGLLRVRVFSFTNSKRKNKNQNQDSERHGLRGALALGIVSGLAVGPCNIAYISPVLSIAMSQAAASPAVSIGLVLFYTLGYCLVLIVSGTCTQWASRWLQGQNFALRVVNMICGIALVLSGIYLIHEQSFLSF